MNNRDSHIVGRLIASLPDSPYENLTMPDFCRQLVQRSYEMGDVPESRRVNLSGKDDRSVVRTATSNAQIVETITTVVGARILLGSQQEPDSTKGWVYETDAANFLPGTFFTLEKGARLEKLAPGTPAKHTSFGAKGEPYCIARYAGQFVLDEMSLLDGNHVGAVLLAASQQGAAAARLRPDLIYSLLLSNPTLTADNVALFHATHGNYATGGGSALSATTISTGLGAVGLQCLTAETDGRPIHSNLTANYLIVPPQLVGAAWIANYSMGSQLTVRQESRLSALGVVDPKTGNTYAGTATNWLLAANSESRPTIVIGGLDGSLAPQVRQTKLDMGQWGVIYDIVCDIGAAAIDYRGVYWAAGA